MPAETVFRWAPGRLSRFLVESTTSEVVGNDHIRDSVKDKLDVLRVSSTCHVTVNLLGCGFVLGLKLSVDVAGSFALLLSSCVLWETYRQWRS